MEIKPNTRARKVKRGPTNKEGPAPRGAAKVMAQAQQLRKTRLAESAEFSKSNERVAQISAGTGQTIEQSDDIGDPHRPDAENGAFSTEVVTDRQHSSHSEARVELSSLPNAKKSHEDAMEQLSVRDGEETESCTATEKSRREVLKKTCPQKQAKAVKILIDEEKALVTRIASLSPSSLRQEGLVQYGLTAESIEDGVVPELKVLRLRTLDMSTTSSNQITKGQTVLLSEQYEDPNDATERTKKATEIEFVKGIISEVGVGFFEIAIDERFVKKVPNGTIQMEKTDTTQVYQRMLLTIDKYQLAEQGKIRLPMLAEIVRGRGPAKIAASTARFNPGGLDRSQQNAVRHALGSSLCVIKGPPGTGKSEVLQYAILELLRKGENVLICCGSNAAVDNLIAKLDRYSHRFPIARLGHPYRINACVRHHSVEVLQSSGRRFNPRKVRIVATTLHGACGLENYPAANTIVIDEVCQALQAQCWIPLLHNEHAKRLIIAGDDKQLPPTITSQSRQVRTTLNITLFDVLISCFGEQIMQKLDTQYRMSEEIMQFSSQQLYDGSVEASRSVAKQKLYQVPRVLKSPVTTPSVMWIDTSSLGYTEETSRETGLLCNTGEAALVKEHCSRLQGQGVRLADIGVISPYANQRDVIQRMMPSVEVNTVDAFQGQDKNVIILSLVRSNSAGNIGFLADERRLNVAITRAKFQLCVVASMDTLRRCKSVLLNKWVAWCEENAKIILPGRDGAITNY